MSEYEGKYHTCLEHYLDLSHLCQGKFMESVRGPINHSPPRQVHKHCATTPYGTCDEQQSSCTAGRAVQIAKAQAGSCTFAAVEAHVSALLSLVT